MNTHRAASVLVALALMVGAGWGEDFLTKPKKSYSQEDCLDTLNKPIMVVSSNTIDYNKQFYKVSAVIARYSQNNGYQESKEILFCDKSMRETSCQALTICQSAIALYQADSITRFFTLSQAYKKYDKFRKKYDKALLEAAKKYAFYPSTIELVDVDVIGYDTFDICTRGLVQDKSKNSIERNKYHCFSANDYICYSIR